MLFTSIEFLLFFLPVVVFLHFIIPKRFRNFWLLLSSLFFYAWGEPDFVLVMFFSIIFNFVMAKIIEKSRGGVKKYILVIDISVNLGILVIFKYLNFIIMTLINSFPSATNWLHVTSIALPIGISFFTFQAMSYVIDVYRGIPAQKNLINLGLYISLFPQLIAGPIVRYTTIMDQIFTRVISLDSFSKGIIRFLEGFNKKVILANSFSLVADAAFSAQNNSVCMAWLGAFCYTLQIFFDFSGYSDMAIGLGSMFGFKFLENFNYPYVSCTVTEFWRRWHISLGTWFRDYVYFPLGGSRVKTKSKIVFNLFIVWLLTGIWHGANWTFIVWGLLYGVIITVEKLVAIPEKLHKCGYLPSLLYSVFTFIMVMNGWVLFRSVSLESAFLYLKTMFGATNSVFMDDIFLFNIREYIVFLLAGILCSTPIFKLIREKLCLLENQKQILTFPTEFNNGIYFMFQFLLFIISFSFLVIKAHNPFIYYNF